MKKQSIFFAALISVAFINTTTYAATKNDKTSSDKTIVVEEIITPVVIENVRVTTYLNGGIGKEEEAAMRRVAQEFPLRMTFSESKDGEFVVDIPVVIQDEHGTPIFELPKAGPMLYVMLPNGKYKVSARLNGLSEIQEVTLSGKPGKDLNFHWQGKPQ